jgi:3',5'-cyclic AMP phosphodiesterase CpdA
MGFVSDPPTSIKIRKMKERVRWQDPVMVERQIDQTRFVLDHPQVEQSEFSFLVIGDSGSGPHYGYNPQRQIAEQMLPHHEDCCFVLHTGDVIYLVGSSEYYPPNFIQPYRELLVNGDRITYDNMVFKLPMLPVPGNHDYYDLPLIYGLLSQATLPLRRLLQARLDFDVGWHGSYQGMAYTKAFLDYLKDFNTPDALKTHLDQHYTAQTDTGYCLRYQPGQFTRLPNRYYTFCFGGIDFFALDSNTFNAPSPLPDTLEGDAHRRLLQKRLDDIQQEKNKITETVASLNPNSPNEAEQINDVRTKLEQLEEMDLDIRKQLQSNEAVVIDMEQLEWLEQRLIASWLNPDVRGRVLYFHHPPYVTEATKWHQAQTLAIRQRLRWVFDRVAKSVGPLAADRPLINLILNGHAHCLEYLRTEETGHADSHLNWIICGGSGYSLRRQRVEGPDLQALRDDLRDDQESDHVIARSLLYVGRKGHGSQKRHPYSFLRINVKAGSPPKFEIQPFISERFQHQWFTSQLESFVL